MLLKREGVVGETVGCPTVPFQALAAQIEAKPLDQTLELAAASRLTAKIVGDHLSSGLGRGHFSRAGVVLICI